MSQPHLTAHNLCDAASTYALAGAPDRALALWQKAIDLERPATQSGRFSDGAHVLALASFLTRQDELALWVIDGIFEYERLQAQEEDEPWPRDGYLAVDHIRKAAQARLDNNLDEFAQAIRDWYQAHLKDTGGLGAAADWTSGWDTIEVLLHEVAYLTGSTPQELRDI